MTDKQQGQQQIYGYDLSTAAVLRGGGRYPVVTI